MFLEQPSRAGEADDWLDGQIAALRERVEDEGHGARNARERADGPALGGPQPRGASSYTGRAIGLPFRLAAVTGAALSWGAAVLVAKRYQIGLYALVAGISAAVGIAVTLLLSVR